VFLRLFGLDGSRVLVLLSTGFDNLDERDNLPLEELLGAVGPLSNLFFYLSIVMAGIMVSRASLWVGLLLVVVRSDA
jgi:hypothetical protein